MSDEPHPHVPDLHLPFCVSIVQVAPVQFIASQSTSARGFVGFFQLLMMVVDMRYLKKGQEQDPTVCGVLWPEHIRQLCLRADPVAFLNTPVLFFLGKWGIFLLYTACCSSAETLSRIYYSKFVWMDWLYKNLLLFLVVSNSWKDQFSGECVQIVFPCSTETAAVFIQHVLRKQRLSTCVRHQTVGVAFCTHSFLPLTFTKPS